MRILDRYVVLSYLKAYLAVFCLLMLLIILFDFILNIDEFFKNYKRPGGPQYFSQVLGHVLSYYVVRVPLYFALLAGAITVIAAGFTLGRMSWAGEFTALLASGVSLRRVLLPTAAAGALLNLLLVIDQEMILPAFKEQLLAERDDLGGTGRFSVDGYRDDRNNLVFAASFSPRTGRMHDVQIVERRIGPDGRSLVVSTVLADAAQWLPDDAEGRTGTWTLTAGRRLVREGAVESGPVGLRPDPPGPVAEYRSNMNPISLRRHRSSRHLDLLSYPELARLAQEPSLPLYLAGEIGVRMHLRVTQPLMNMLLMLTAVPLFLTREHRNIILSAALCMLIVGGGLGASFAASQWAFELAEPVWSLAGAWLPVILTAPAAVWSVMSIRT